MLLRSVVTAVVMVRPFGITSDRGMLLTSNVTWGRKVEASDIRLPIFSIAIMSGAVNRRSKRVRASSVRPAL